MSVVMITGCSSGFGLAAARRFAGRGDRVVAAARRTERLRSLADELGRDVLLPLTLDVRDRASVERVASTRWTSASIDRSQAGTSRPTPVGVAVYACSSSCSRMNDGALPPCWLS